MALQSGGGAWDLDALRAGGAGAESFTAAFVDGKVGEITASVPEPSSLASMLAGLGALAAAASRRRHAVPR